MWHHQQANIILIGRRSSRLIFRFCKNQQKYEGEEKRKRKIFCLFTPRKLPAGVEGYMDFKLFIHFANAREDFSISGCEHGGRNREGKENTTSWWLWLWKWGAPDVLWDFYDKWFLRGPEVHCSNHYSIEPSIDRVCNSSFAWNVLRKN